MLNDPWRRTIHGASSILPPGNANSPLFQLGRCRSGNIVRSVFACAFFAECRRAVADEAVLVRLSLLPSVSEVWQNLPHDSCPILMHLAVRAWSAAGLGNTDLGLRVSGLFAGLFLLLAFWFASWTMRNGAPLLAVTLAGLDVCGRCLGSARRLCIAFMLRRHCMRGTR